MFGYPKWRAWAVIIVSVLGIFFSIPNFMSTSFYETHVPAKMQKWWHPMTLGLDLQGGSNLLLEIQVNELINERLSSLADGARSALREGKIKFSGLKVEDGHLRVKILDASDLVNAQNIITKQETEKMEVEHEDNELIITYSDIALDKIKADAASQSIDIVRRRIDELGTKEPSIQRQGTDRIAVQLPGVQNPAEVKALLGKTAKMSFHLVDNSVSLADAQRGKLPLESMIVSGDETGPLVLKRAVVVSGEQLDRAMWTAERSVLCSLRQPRPTTIPTSGTGRQTWRPTPSVAAMQRKSCRCSAVSTTRSRQACSSGDAYPTNIIM